MYHWILLLVFCRPCRMGIKVARNIYAPTAFAALRMYLSGGMFYESLRGLIVNELHVPSLHSLDAKEGFVGSMAVRYTLPYQVWYPPNHMSFFIVLNRDVDVFLSLGKCWYAIHG